ncbi:MAG TPA: gluconokinase [Micromonosporaceae bacterium]
MGVAGAGKTTVGRLLAQRQGWSFVDGDALHPPRNIAAMAAGIPLTDTDRWPWLDRVAAWLNQRRAAGEVGVVACSALKRVYRDRLREADPDLRVVYLAGEPAPLRQRLAHRPDHFFPAALLAAQLADLEPPAPQEHAITVAFGLSPDDAVATVVARLSDTGRS